MRNLITHLLDRLMKHPAASGIFALCNLVLLVRLAIEVGWQRQYEWLPLLLAQAVNTWYSFELFLENVDL